MLTLTDNATAIVSTLVSRRSSASEAGLRIHTTDEPGADGAARFAVDVASAPEAADAIVEASGARIFLEEQAAVALSDKVLDAAVDDEGAVSFAVLAQTV
ncbi:Fe-S cluster assembly iron-binding protein IscA [Microbacterium keratanolyticum]|uniref:Fe-S cluster assembly iron-binding protein IscA n=1 Tax=Microbacterium keratanolyticum TaxID=67574 RepID=A0A9W6HS82_9MICO|nr:Fe-S cluster assembly protein HesB [Microbacterium keratanolyticum]MBM7469867.1 Fe-S cluster assembly iron-binding protein IscA [Microbacterium keratanolyticum]GLK01948.1 hypothetical protein GCM10017596_16630 [Microbacterium keratanolyticum]